MFGNIGWMEVLLIVGIVFLLFGGKRIKETMKSLGEGIGEFKKAVKDGEAKE